MKTAPKRIRADPAALPVNPRVSVTKTLEDFAKGLMAAFRGEENLYPEKNNGKLLEKTCSNYQKHISEASPEYPEII